MRALHARKRVDSPARPFHIITKREGHIFANLGIFQPRPHPQTTRSYRVGICINQQIRFPLLTHFWLSSHFFGPTTILFFGYHAYPVLRCLLKLSLVFRVHPVSLARSRALQPLEAPATLPLEAAPALNIHKSVNHSRDKRCQRVSAITEYEHVQITATD